MGEVGDSERERHSRKRRARLEPHPAMLHPDSWMPDQIVYQIFPDRFAVGSPHTSETKLALAAYQGPGIQTRRWDDPPAGNHDFYGGDLQGIADRLDYLEDLGVTCLYLTPIFASPSNHKYDTVDYLQVDPQFGDEAVLLALIQAVHDRGMRIILDISINHVSHRHPWFVAAQEGQTPFSEYFVYRNGEYLRWRDHPHMPELNLSHPALQKILFAWEDSVLQRYLAMGIDGWRFDVAPDVGLAMADAIREALSRRFPRAAMIGEVMAFGGDFVQDGARYHGVMNYYFRDAVLAWLSGEISGWQMAEAARDSYFSSGHDGSLASWNMLSSHDTPRLATVLPDSWRRWLALVAQFTLPGVPLVYYGEEIGMLGGPDPDCRRGMIWDASRWDVETQQRYKSLVAMRRERPELRHGRLIVLSHSLNTDALIFIRHTDIPEEVALVALNPTDQPVRRLILLPYSHLYHALPMTNLLGSSTRLQMEAGSVRVDLPPRSAAVWVPDATQFRHYNFYKSPEQRIVSIPGTGR